ncbi:hypothetical protein [Streptomyces sp. BK79]|uniref:hypothetical protein n=1 Tax=Streptomyces sp. BK79 TaxID=3350097 RepID=UPI003770510C
MREKPDDADGAEVRTEAGARRIDLSVPQVAGSALAAVVAAKLASSFGVYGTILGAGLISVVATCGGSVLQHFFSRTGEQLRVKRTVESARTGGRTETAPLPAGGPHGPAPARAQTSASASARTSASASASGEFTEGTVYRARTTGWKRPVVAAALVFGVTMAGITAYELASGESLSGGRSTTVGSAVSGHDKSASDSGDRGDSDGTQDGKDSQDTRESGGPVDPGESGAGEDAPAATPSGTPSGAGDGTPSDGGTSTDEDGGTASSPTPAPDATGDAGGGDDATSPAPDASATAPEPGASSRSGTDGQGQDGPAAP